MTLKTTHLRNMLNTQVGLPTAATIEEGKTNRVKTFQDFKAQVASVLGISYF